MLTALNDADVDYLVVGAYAMAAHGCPRATGDIDIWVRPNHDNAGRLMSALRAFGAPLSKVTVADFYTPDIVYQIGLPPQRIDILTSVSGVAFDDAWPERMNVDLDGLRVPIISLRCLHENKLASGREKDRIDATVIGKLLG